MRVFTTQMVGGKPVHTKHRQLTTADIGIKPHQNCYVRGKYVDTERGPSYGLPEKGGKITVYLAVTIPKYIHKLINRPNNIYVNDKISFAGCRSARERYARVVSKYEEMTKDAIDNYTPSMGTLIDYLNYRIDDSIECANSRAHSHIRQQLTGNPDLLKHNGLTFEQEEAAVNKAKGEYRRAKIVLRQARCRSAMQLCEKGNWEFDGYQLPKELRTEIEEAYTSWKAFKQNSIFHD